MTSDQGQWCRPRNENGCEGKEKIAQARFPAVLRKRCYRVKEKSSQETFNEETAEKPDLERCEESL